ncbi:hypothetical protein [Bradyrhizobium sp. STM 3562]|uniref:hypothetical protein n=1 Tax=Bradyrhizobium sp. STM 3562 TaxID=578924 RepID=UPI00388F74F2
MRMNLTAMLAILALSLTSIPAVDARGGHGFGHGGFGHGVHGSHGMGGHGAGFSGDQRHANDTYVNAASEEEDKLLDTKIKSICRGC